MAELRIAMWSGPRNISTALLRAWESRSDTFVTDEPLYGPYLAATKKQHPGADEVIRTQGPDWRPITERLAGPIPHGKHVWYQKHMAHHLLPEMERDWLDRLAHAFLIRDPAEMLLSLDKVFPDPSLEDTGLPQQVEIYRRTAALGSAPPVVDARDVLEDPERMLRLLCEALHVPFEEAMLSWEPGPRATDGIWAKHWYAAVERSTGFQPPPPRREELPDRLRAVHRECIPHYEELWEQRLGR